LRALDLFYLGLDPTVKETSGKKERGKGEVESVFERPGKEKHASPEKKEISRRRCLNVPLSYSGWTGRWGPQESPVEW